MSSNMSITGQLWEVIHTVSGYNSEIITFEKFKKYIQKKLVSRKFATDCFTINFSYFWSYFDSFGIFWYKMTQKKNI